MAPISKRRKLRFNRFLGQRYRELGLSPGLLTLPDAYWGEETWTTEREALWEKSRWLTHLIIITT